jgi:CheY-like chemotaxis protein
MKRTTPANRLSHEVLVVEDEPQMRGLLGDNLEYEGYRVTAVASAEEALIEFERRAVSLVILDIMHARGEWAALHLQRRTQLCPGAGQSPLAATKFSVTHGR